MEFDSTTVVSWANSYCSVRWEFAYLISQLRTLSSIPLITIRHVFRKATSAVNLMANWACTHQTCQRVFTSEDLPFGLSGILRLDGLKFSYICHWFLAFVLLVISILWEVLVNDPLIIFFFSSNLYYKLGSGLTPHHYGGFNKMKQTHTKTTMWSFWKRMRVKGCGRFSKSNNT